MEVLLPSDLENKILHRAAQQGCKADELICDVLARYLEDDARFLDAVENGIRAADAGEFIEEEEMDARVEAMFRKG